MNVLYFTDRDLTRGNAESVHVVEVVRSLASQGHNVTLISPVEATPIPGVQSLAYGSDRPAAASSLRGLRQRLIGPLFAARQMRAGPYDGMYVRLAVPILLTTWLLRWACGERPMILEVNGILRSELSRQRRMLYSPIRPLEGVLLRQASAIVAASEEIQRDLVTRHHPIYVVAIPNGVNPDRFHPMPQQEARQALGLDLDDPIIGFVGNFAPWHGIEVLLRAAPSIRERHPKARIMLVGGGSHGGAIEAEIERTGCRDMVDLVGVVPHELVPTYMNAFSCCVSPAIPLGSSDPGRNSLKVFEYLACGVPVVLSDLPGVAGLVRERRLGAAVPPADEAALARAISDVLSLDSRERERIRTDARASVISEFSWDANVARVVKLFEDHLPSSPEVYFAPAVRPMDIDSTWSSQ
ncbi:MAG: glycosyltransferase family 4 protein [Thermomicrobiales bacterium]|nr:glycosyltransferase family 4 protein [Thermomicrobiales bacterium]